MKLVTGLNGVFEVDSLLVPGSFYDNKFVHVIQWFGVVSNEIVCSKTCRNCHHFTTVHFDLIDPLSVYSLFLCHIKPQMSTTQ